MTKDMPPIPEMNSYQEISEFETAPRLNKKVLLVTALDDEAEERAYWHAQTPLQRIIALEQMRQIIYNYDPHTTRMLKVMEIIDRNTGV